MSDRKCCATLADSEARAKCEQCVYEDKDKGKKWMLKSEKSGWVCAEDTEPPADSLLATKKRR